MRNKVELSPALTAISPCDGRYAHQTKDLNALFSEYGLIRQRVAVEIAWIQKLASLDQLTEIPPLSQKAQNKLDEIITKFDPGCAQQVKDFEKTTNHDVKAVEHYLQAHFAKDSELSKIQSFIHFACTSEDINNLAWRKNILTARDDILIPFYARINQHLKQQAQQYASLPMLARTHGQAASPTTLGKELANFSTRLQRQITGLQQIALTGKFNGAVGNFNAHTIAYPEIDWISVSVDFIRAFGLEPNLCTTQIEPNDTLAEMLHGIHRINRIFVDFAQDIWLYIALDLMKQKKKVNETGSSTMPHKVNPIDFENAEGNFGIANTLADYFATKLTVSRLQRDLTDSTTLRALGLVFAHTLIALHALEKGLNKITPNRDKMDAELNQHWEVLTEAIQTTMRRYQIPDAFEKIKALSRGQVLDQAVLQQIIESLDIPAEARQTLLDLTPATYTGLAEKLARKE